MAILGLVDQKRVRKVVLGPLVLLHGGEGRGRARERPWGPVTQQPGPSATQSRKGVGSYKPRSDVPAPAPGWGSLARHVNFLSFTWRAGVMTPLRNKTTEEAGTVKFSSVSYPGIVACGKCPLAWWFIREQYERG